MNRVDRLSTRNAIVRLKGQGIAALGRAELLCLLRARGGEQEDLFACAREVRRRSSGDELLLRGVIEVSNVCQKNCAYCAMRAKNRGLERYTMGVEEIMEIARAVHDAGIGVVMLQSGQNPTIDELLLRVVPAIRSELGMSVLLCSGERSRLGYDRLLKLGADSYILKFETSNRELYRSMTGVELEGRLQALKAARAAGFLIGTGNIVGLPEQTPQSLVEDLLLGIEVNPDFISSAPFIPNTGTPFEGHPRGDLETTLNTLAIFRVALPRALIPSVSALESSEKGGQWRGLNAGANVMTINFTPQERRSLYRIYSEQRFIVSLAHSLATAERAGMRVRGARSAASRHHAVAPRP